MPIYMDLHIVPGVNAKDVAEAHSMDVLNEKDHSCKCITYWVDELRGHVFCLIDASDKNNVIELHNKAHGLTPHKIIEVQPTLVASFLGRITDPENTQVTDTGLLIIDDTSFRILMKIEMTDPVFLLQQSGVEKTNELVAGRNKLIRKEITIHNGREAIQEGTGFVASFVTAEKAVACAASIYQQLMQDEGNAEKVCISIHAGEPVSGTEKLFGETIQFIKAMCMLKKNAGIRISSGIKELISKALIQQQEKIIAVLSPQDEQLLTSLNDALELNYRESDFSVDEFCKAMAMSKSQLFRKTTELTGFSPNELLKEYRLEKACDQIRKMQGSITDIAYQTGFSSSSYFTKCFKKKYDLLPLKYLELAKQS